MKPVHQEQPKDLPAFLTEVATDAATREQLYALAQYAELERQNPNLLHIQAFAERAKQYTIEVISPNNIRTSTVFNTRIWFSLPGTVQTLRVLQTSEKSADPKTQEVKVFDRKNLRQSLTLDVTFIQETLQPAENYGLILEMKLQKFVKWTLQMPQLQLNSNIYHKGAKSVKNGEEYLILRWDFMNTLQAKNWVVGIHHKTLPHYYHPVPVQRDPNDPLGQIGNMDTRFDFYSIPPPPQRPASSLGITPPTLAQQPGSFVGITVPPPTLYSGNLTGMAPPAPVQQPGNSVGNPKMETNNRSTSTGAGQ